MPRPFSDITGQCFNRLTAIQFVERKDKRTIWKFTCSCGNSINTRVDQVVRGSVKSCGCMLKEAAPKKGINSRFKKGSKAHNKGRNWDEWMSEDGQNALKKPVVQLTELDEVVAIHESCRAGADAIGAKLTEVARVCRHYVRKDGYECKTVRGYKFLFLDEFLDRRDKARREYFNKKQELIEHFKEE